MKKIFRLASFSLVIGAVSLCPGEGLRAQTANLPALASGFNNYLALTGASTGCGYFPGGVPLRPQESPTPSKGDSGGDMPLLVSGHDPGGDSDNAPIVGFWKVKFVSQGNTGIPDGVVIDDGYATWHSDGTEIQNSSRAPITGNFCMGAWKRTRRGTYKLNHFGLSWDPTGAFFIGPANIKEELSVDRSGNNYSGTFTIEQFDTNGNLLAHISGLVTAERITAD